MNATAKSERQRKQPNPMPAPSGDASPQARRQAAAILEVLAGMRRPCEAAQVLEISLPRYYQLERRAVQGLVTACEPVPRGRQQNAGRQLARLEREKQRLQRECDRQQALLRAAQRSLGLLPPTPAKSSGKETSPSLNGAGHKRHRNRRPMVRALKVARALAPEESKAEVMAAPNPAMTSASK